MKRTIALLGIPVAVFTLAACGGNDRGFHAVSDVSLPTSPAPTTTVPSQHNEQDIKFAQGMIPHHEQAVEMAEVAETRASNPEVKQLATSIKRAQEPEIKQLTGWLRSWNAATPTSDPEHHVGEGMMSEQEMTKLESLSGTQFDRMFLTMMIKHHQGAITMAKAEQAGGQSSEAKSLAGEIVKSQSAEITKMQDLLKQR